VEVAPSRFSDDEGATNRFNLLSKRLLVGPESVIKAGFKKRRHPKGSIPITLFADFSFPFEAGHSASMREAGNAFKLGNILLTFGPMKELRTILENSVDRQKLESVATMLRG
jgi:hypothetical protein